MTGSTIGSPGMSSAGAVDPEADWTSGKDRRLVPYGDTNLGTPPELHQQLITPTEVFFVRSNYPVPDLDAELWRLRVRGLVRTELELSLADLRSMQQRTVTAFLECAGNSRTRFSPAVDGTPWREDAIGNARWSGVPLAHVLALAGVGPEAVEVVSQGGDHPDMRRGLPLATALDSDTLLALDMNGEPLRRAHGFPARLLVPGWGGIASTKWLVDLELVATPFDGYWNTEKYVLVDATGAHAGAVQNMPVKSLLVEPEEGAEVPPGRTTLAGYAWSGRGPVTRVEVSTDGGESYTPAQVVEQDGPRSWVRWTCSWEAVPGEHQIWVRAVDATGQAQPVTPSWNVQGYQMNAVLQRTVRVQR